MWVQFLNIMIVPFDSCLFLELSVSAVLAQTLWTLAKFTTFFAPLNSQTKHIPRRLRSAFITIAKKLIVSKRHPLFHDPATVSVYLSAISPSYYIRSYHSLSHSMHVQTYSMMYINCINKPDNFLEFASEISGLVFYGQSSNWSRDTAENVHCSSGTVHWIIDPSIPNIKGL
jgi:hypothetical protein